MDAQEDAAEEQEEDDEEDGTGKNLERSTKT